VKCKSFFYIFVFMIIVPVYFSRLDYVYALETSIVDNFADLKYLIEVNRKFSTGEKIAALWRFLKQKPINSYERKLKRAVWEGFFGSALLVIVAIIGWEVGRRQGNSVAYFFSMIFILLAIMTFLANLDSIARRY